MQNLSTAYAVKKSENCFEVIGLDNEIYITIYPITGKIKVHKLMDFLELFTILNFIYQNFTVYEN